MALAGCGGGGGGGASGPTFPPGTFFYDDFSGSSLDRSIWNVSGSGQMQQRTAFGFEPALRSQGSDTFAQLRLDTYNPATPDTFKGTEIVSKQKFSLGSGLRIEARLRAPDLPPGIVFAFFMLGDRYEGPATDANYRKTEIDYEFLTQQQAAFRPKDQRNRLYTNIWNDWNQGLYGFDLDPAPSSTREHDDKVYAPARQSGYDYAEWNTYRIDWYPDHTEYWVNDRLERTETEVRPDDPMSVRFNMWSSRPDFIDAYNADFQPANSADDSDTYTFDVDYVRISPL